MIISSFLFKCYNMAHITIWGIWGILYDSYSMSHIMWILFMAIWRYLVQRFRHCFLNLFKTHLTNLCFSPQIWSVPTVILRIVDYDWKSPLDAGLSIVKRLNGPWNRVWHKFVEIDISASETNRKFNHCFRRKVTFWSIAPIHGVLDRFLNWHFRFRLEQSA